MNKTGRDRQRIIAASGYLEKQGDLSLQAAVFSQGYRLVKKLTNDETRELGNRLNERFASREQNDIGWLLLAVEIVSARPQMALFPIFSSVQDLIPRNLS